MVPPFMCRGPWCSVRPAQTVRCRTLTEMRLTAERGAARAQLEAAGAALDGDQAKQRLELLALRRRHKRGDDEVRLRALRPGALPVELERSGERAEPDMHCGPHGPQAHFVFAE